MPMANAIPGASTTLLDYIGRMFNSWIPSGDDFSTGERGFLGEGSSLAWGGSTLEVVKTQATYLTRPATFGPRITSDDGQRGELLPISEFYKVPPSKTTTIFNRGPLSYEPLIDNHGCPYKGGPGWRDEDYDDDGENDLPESGRNAPLRLQRSASAQTPPKDWVALVERGGGCAFIAKVRVAQALGATAVVVGDAPSPGYEKGPGSDPGEDSDPGLSGRLVTMFAPGDTSDIHVPSTFVTRPSYLDLIRLIEEMDREKSEKKQACSKLDKEGSKCENQDNGGLEVILGRDDIMWEWPLIDLAFLLLLLPSFMTVTTLIVHRIRLARQRRKERAPEPVVSGLPCLIWRGNGQPWEKVEGVVSSEDIDSNSINAVSAHKTVTGLSPTSDASHDMELGEPPTPDQSGQVPVPVEDEEAQPGPSTRLLKTRPVPPPVPTEEHSYLPPGRAYYSCDECAICLSEFVDGDKVRVLPCGHVFHLAEIDSWLLRVRKLCPICKRDITVPIPPTPPAPSLLDPANPSPSGGESENDSTAGDELDETSPLLSRSTD